MTLDTEFIIAGADELKEMADFLNGREADSTALKAAENLASNARLVRQMAEGLAEGLRHRLVEERQDRK